jgi:hypothetical protein
LASIVGLWALLGFLATLPVTGNHPYWRRFRILPEDFHLKAENVSFSSLDGTTPRLSPLRTYTNPPS